MKVYIVSQTEDLFDQNSDLFEQGKDSILVTIFRTRELAEQYLEFQSDRYEKVQEIEAMLSLRIIELEVKSSKVTPIEIRQD